METVGVWSNLWRSEAKDWVMGRATEVDAPSQLLPGSSYVSVFLRRMRIVNARVGFSKFCATVQGYARLPHLSGQKLEFATVTTPSQMRDATKKDFGSFVFGSHRILGPVPYQGGDLELEIGLFATQSQDMLKPYLDVLEDLSTAAGVSLFTVAKPYIEPLRKGIGLLTGGANPSSLEIGLATTYEKPVTGRYFVARLDAKDYPAATFSLDQDNYLLDRQGRRVENAAYFVFSIESDPVRGDWMLIPDVAEAYAGLNESIVKQRPFKDITSHREHLRRCLYASPDLIEGHARQIDDWVSQRLEAALGGVKTAAESDQRGLPDLASFNLAPLVDVA